MCSSARVKNCFDDFEIWNTAWHESFKRRNPKWKESMYVDGQFDDIPHWIWEENELIDEFDFHDELIKYGKEN